MADGIEHPIEYDAPLDAASRAARRWLTGLQDRPFAAPADVEAVKDALGRDLPADGRAASDVIEHLAETVEPALLLSQSGRFFGWVFGGTLPAALAADWLVGAWDQDALSRSWMPGTTAAEELAGEWVADLLGFPASTEVGFVTGATMANFSGLLVGRDTVLADAGWDVSVDGLAGAPPVRVVVGAACHASVLLALRYLGLGAPVVVGADDQGRIDVAALERELAASDAPTLVCLQAGDLHSGAFDDFAGAVAVAHEAGAWVHVDGAFGLWAAASPSARHLTAGLAGVDSASTDAHKTLNAPYDCGIVFCTRPGLMQRSLGTRASYLPPPGATPDPMDTAPEMSRRARGVPVYAALAALGRDGVAALVDRLIAGASRLAAGLEAIPGVQVLNDLEYTQVCVALEDDAATDAAYAHVMASGEAFVFPSVWRGRHVIRFSVSNWTTGEAEIDRTIEAVRRAASEAG
ncbi:aspartate aminotransferase family protein [Agromyces rhizosphaerae]|uniref:Aspartate aminotransferase family protein n=1 Tax=Agromyces rhizosphaerae TaxID=88374 RepID=A0A9W6FMV8_9MICO|nr:aminotransferase class V-fold PLP-dependent enzyme [Agromyces rhizosphaerae]GLI25785.1 aspartate aminotransferase family protein [Agromyces rhizosphaerae]